MAASSQGTIDRRQSDRLPFPAELVLVWNHDMAPERARRYRVLDAGDGGFRIHSDDPLGVEMTGMVLRVLPDRGRSLDQAVQVAWQRPCLTNNGFEIGLRCIGV